MPMETPSTPVVSLRERLKSPPATAMIESYFAPAVAASIRHVFDHEMRIHLAHAMMLGEQGIIETDEMVQILAVLTSLRADGAGVLEIDNLQEDAYSYVEKYLVAQLGPETGGRLHTGRSRNDLHTTSWRMALREKLMALSSAVFVLRKTMLRLARAHVCTIMPGYTHTQHAQPISFGYYLLAAADLLQRDSRRIESALACCDRSPLGAGALSTTGFPINREMTARDLGFAELVEVAYDAVAIRDDLQEASTALAVMMTGISRVATDLQTWNTMEFGFVELDDAYSSVSSIMPQKKNPQALEHVKGVAAMATGNLITVLSSAKNTALADVNDGVSSGNVPCVEAIDRATRAIRVFDGALATLSVRPEVMLHAAKNGFGTATELADVIVRLTPLSFRMSHNVVGRVVRKIIEEGRSAMEIGTSDLDDAAEHLFGYPLKIDPAEVRLALDPTENVRSRIVTGGPAPVRMLEMLDRRDAALSKAVTRLNSVLTRIADAESGLITRVAEAMTLDAGANNIAGEIHGKS
jgi:argininosuccinate lyase